MGGKRKKTADRNTAPSKGQPSRKSVAASSPVAVTSPAPAESSAMGGKRKKTADRKTPASKGRPGRKSVAVPSPVAVEAPVASSSTVPHHQPEVEPGTLVSLHRASVNLVKSDSDVPPMVLKCNVCHGILKAPIFQCSLMRHVACRSCNELHGGKCRPCADLAASAVYVQSSYLDTLFCYIKEECPYKNYGCTASFDLGDPAYKAHQAACAFEPCSCRECRFKGSRADLVCHLRGRHAWVAHRLTYGKDYMCDIDEMDSSALHYGLFIGEDGGVFYLIVDLATVFQEFPFPLVTLVCVRNRAAAATGTAYSYWVAEDAPPAERRKLKPEIKEVASCPDWGLTTDYCFRVLPGMLHEEQTGTSVRFRICIIKDESSSASC